MPEMETTSTNPRLQPGDIEINKRTRALARNNYTYGLRQELAPLRVGNKNRLPYLSNEIRDTIITHIMSNAKQKNIYIDSLNGYKDHIHCLLSIGPGSDIIKDNSDD